MIINKLEKFTFGKYRNKTILWVIQNDPTYLLWTYENLPYANYSDDILLQAVKCSRLNKEG